MKRFFIAMMVIALMVSLMTGCGGRGGGSGGDNETGGKPIQVGSINGEDPCECCPDCVQLECDCEECVDSADCKCGAGGGGVGSYTYKVEFYAYVAGWRPIHKTYGIATVTMDQTDASGYFGSAPGEGEYTEELIPETGQVEKTFDFTAKLKDYVPTNAETITVGLDRIGAKEVTNYAKDSPDELVLGLPDMGNVILALLARDYMDPSSDPLDMDTWLFNFPVPMEDGIGYKVFSFDRADAEFEGHVELSIHVNPAR